MEKWELGKMLQSDAGTVAAWCGDPLHSLGWFTVECKLGCQVLPYDLMDSYKCTSSTWLSLFNLFNTYNHSTSEIVDMAGSFSTAASRFEPKIFIVGGRFDMGMSSCMGKPFGHGSPPSS